MKRTFCQCPPRLFFLGPPPLFFLGPPPLTPPHRGEGDFIERLARNRRLDDEGIVGTLKTTMIGLRR